MTSDASGPASPPPSEEQPAPRESGSGTAAGSTRKVAVDRLEDQIGWYDRKSAMNQRWFKRLKGVQLVAAAAIPVAATFPLDGWVTGTLGAGIVVLEGFQQLNQHQQNWISYRSTCESLRHEHYLFEAGAGPYAATDDPPRLLAERVEALISQEHAKWVDTRKEAAEQLQSSSPPVAPGATDSPHLG